MNQTRSGFSFWLIALLIILLSMDALKDARSKSAARQTYSDRDAALFTLFDQLNSQDIEMANLALARSRNTPVQTLAHMIIEDHGNFGAQAHMLAKKSGLAQVSKNPELALAHERRMAELRSASVDKFDGLYLNHELAFSKAFVTTLKEHIYPGTRQTELKRFFKNILSSLNEHLAHIEHVTHGLSSH